MDFDNDSATPSKFMNRTDPRETYSFLKDIIDPMASMDVLKHILRGEEFNIYDQKWFLPENAQPRLNEIGIQKVMAELSRVSKDTNLSNLKEEEINLIQRQFGIVLNDLLYNDSEKMGLKVEDYQSTFLLIYHHVKFSLKRAQGAGERGLLQPAIGFKESHDDKSQGGGGFGFNIGRN